MGRGVMKGGSPFMGRRYRKGDRIATLWDGIMVGEYPLCGEGKSGAKHEVEVFFDKEGVRG